MKILKAYKYILNNHSVVSINKPKTEYTTLYRLIAGEGKMLTLDGEHLTPVIDVESIEGWYEVDKPAPVERSRGRKQ